MKKQWIQRVWGVVLACTVLGLSGCAATKIAADHPLLEKGGQAAAAKVYFIRPFTERAMGFPDNPLSVEFDEKQLLLLGKGEYSLVYLKPREATTMTLKSLTAVGPNWTVKEMSKSRRWSFMAGTTYYVVLRPVDGEFRGVHFTAESVDLFTARESVRRLRPVGEAKRSPI